VRGLTAEERFVLHDDDDEKEPAPWELPILDDLVKRGLVARFEEDPGEEFDYVIEMYRDTPLAALAIRCDEYARRLS
jgi:hypothetical protein